MRWTCLPLLSPPSWRCFIYFPRKIRWRHIIRNLRIRNRDPHSLIFLNFLLWVKELVNADCRFGFLVKNCAYSQLVMSRIPKFGPNIRNLPDSRIEKCHFLSYVSTVYIHIYIYIYISPQVPPNPVYVYIYTHIYQSEGARTAYFIPGCVGEVGPAATESTLCVCVFVCLFVCVCVCVCPLGWVAGGPAATHPQRKP